MWLMHIQKHPELLSNPPSLSEALQKHRAKIILMTGKNWRGREGKKTPNPKLLTGIQEVHLVNKGAEGSDMLFAGGKHI